MPSGFAKDEAAVEMPARVNWGGGWSDTVPYCTDNGGTVLNAPIKIKGKYPIRAAVKKTNEKIVRLENIDLGCGGEYTDKKRLLDLSDADDPFLIHKGALIVSGIVNDGSEALEALLGKIGGGICMSSSVDVPKGSGLGTSSILACACVKALHEIFGIEYDDHILCSQVLLLEQLIGSEGGWQDQMGGMTNGIKDRKSVV
jgi:fucokinase